LLTLLCSLDIAHRRVAVTAILVDELSEQHQWNNIPLARVELVWHYDRQPQSVDKLIIEDRSCLLLVQMRKILWFKLA